MRYSQPQIGPIQVDKTHPLSKSLTSLMLPGVGLIDAVVSRLGTRYGANLTTGVPTPVGLSAAWAGNTQLSYLRYPGAPFVASGKFSIVALLRISSYPDDAATICISGDASSIASPFQLRVNAGGRLQVCQPGVAVHATGNAVLALNTWCVIGVSVDPATGSRFYVRGLPDTVDSWTASFQNDAYGSVGGVTDERFNWRGDIACLATFQGQFLSANDHRMLGQSIAAPWQLFAPSQRVRFPATAGSTVALGATGLGQSTGTADLLKGVTLAGVCLGVVSASAAMSHTVALAATAQATANATGQIALSINLSATAISNAVASAATAIAKPLASAANGQASASADMAVSPLSDTVSLATAAHSQAAAVATLSLAINLSAAAVSQVTASAALNGSASLAAIAISNAQASAALAIGKPLAATATGQANAGATLWLQVPLTAAALAQASAGGGLAVNLNLSAAAIASAQAAAGLAKGVYLGAAAVAHVQAGAAMAQNVAVTLQAGAQSRSDAVASLSYVLQDLQPSPGFGVCARARRFTAVARATP